MNCNKCGATDVAPNSAFCTYCGVSITSGTTSVDSGHVVPASVKQGNLIGEPVRKAQGQSHSELDSISDPWKTKFELLEKAGGVKLPNAKNLPFGERMKVVFNVWGFLFGPFYYLAKGMWKKAVSLLGISVLIIVVLDAICQAMGVSDRITNFVAGAIFASRANIDFYKKVKLGDNGWW